MPSHKDVYEAHADRYDELISREDYQGNILKSIRDITPVEQLDVIDLGAGTGRLANLLAPFARTLMAFDLSSHMLGIARDKLLQIRGTYAWMAAAADHRRLPLPAGRADLIVSGWSVSYVTIWHPETWRHEADDWLSEARRVLRRGGCMILFESLGTGNAQPVRLPHLENFYYWLDEQGFASTWIRTDYRFENLEQARELSGFFFGEEMNAKIETGRSITLPECTGLWWLTA